MSVKDFRTEVDQKKRFEFAKYEFLVDYIENKGFKLVKGNEASSLGCHELVFSKNKKK